MVAVGRVRELDCGRRRRASNSAVCSTGVYDSSGACTGSLAGYPKPVWQAGSGVPADKVRDLPDVSLFASNGVNYTFYPICAVDAIASSLRGQPVSDQRGGRDLGFHAVVCGIMALVNQKYGRQGQADFVLYPLKAQVPAAFHDVTRGTNSVPCAITSVYSEYGTYSPTDCIAVSSPDIVVDPTYGAAEEGEIGSTATNAAEYNATADITSPLASHCRRQSTGDELGQRQVCFDLDHADGVLDRLDAREHDHRQRPGDLGQRHADRPGGADDRQHGGSQPGPGALCAEQWAYASNATDPVNYLPGGTTISGPVRRGREERLSTSAKTQITVSRRTAACT